MAAENRDRNQVAVLVLNYNGWAYTVECLESLGHLHYPDWYVVVVDNGSTDDSVERIRAWARGEVAVQSPYVREPGWAKPVAVAEYEGEPAGHGDLAGESARLVLIRLPENRGFAGGNNVAIRYALRRGADWTWLLNNDTVVSPGSLSEMLKAGQADRRIGVVGCKLLYYDRPDTIQAAGGGRFYPWLGLARHYGWMQRDEGRWQRPFEPHYVTGAAMLVRAECWERVGLLEEGFFFYGEEVEWQLRLRAARWRCFYAPQSVVYHREAASARMLGARRHFEATRSNLLLARKHGGPQLAVASLINLLRALRRLFRGDCVAALAIARAVVSSWCRETC